MKKTISIVLLALLAAVSLFAAPAAETPAKTTATAEAFPTKELTFLCGYGAGGSSDVMVRLMQPYAEKYFGKTMVIENMGGAGGSTALTSFRTRTADGYTMSSFNTTPLLKNVMGQTDYDYFKELEFIGCVVTIPIVIVVRPDSQFKTIDDLLAAAKAKPEDLIIANAGANSITDLAARLWMKKAGIKLTSMPFNGGADALTALLNSTADLEVASLSEVLTKHLDGSVRILASCTNTAILDPSTGKDLGIPVLEGCDVKVIQGVAVHKATDEAIKQILEKGLMGICTDPGYVADMKKAGYDIDYMNRVDFTNYLTSSAADFSELLKSL
jgi:tripartite-type tricarboxylate transporter receptor subunit TctC